MVRFRSASPSLSVFLPSVKYYHLAETLVYWGSMTTLHSTYKSKVEVHEIEGGYQAYLRIEPNPEGGKVDWAKPQKCLNGPTCETPEKAIAAFLKGLKATA